MRQGGRVGMRVQDRGQRTGSTSHAWLSGLHPCCPQVHVISDKFASITPSLPLLLLRCPRLRSLLLPGYDASSLGDLHALLRAPSLRTAQARDSRTAPSAASPPTSWPVLCRRSGACSARRTASPVAPCPPLAAWSAHLPAWRWVLCARTPSSHCPLQQWQRSTGLSRSTCLQPS